jgi:thiamine transport system ATP-binding protein
MLALDRVTYAHPGQTSAYEFTMTALPGEVTAIRGASGSGKSTVLDLIAGFLVPQSGTITLAGKTLLPLKPEERPVSILFQAESLFDHLTAGDNIALGLPARLPAAERASRIAAALDEVGLPEVSRQRAETLSGGQKQRVALARTLLRDRPVLLLDEPFSALDDETRIVTRALVGELTARHDWITVLVTHHADDIAALSKRSYRIVEGRLLAEGAAPAR